MKKVDAFGPLKWSYSKEWETTKDLPPFFGWGRSLYPGDDIGHAVLIRIDTGMRKRPPSKEQLLAWEDAASTGDAVWESIIDELFRAYVRQRPLRERHWRACFGDVGLDRLPCVDRANGLRDLVAPMFVRIRASRLGGRPVQLALTLRCAWLSRLVEVLIERGRFVSMNTFESEIDETALVQCDDAGRIEISSTRTLVRARHNRWWEGKLTCKELSHLTACAEERVHFLHNGAPRLGPTPASTLRWIFGDCTHPVRWFADPSMPPTEGQIAAFPGFASAIEGNAGIILAAVADHYRTHRDVFRRTLAESRPELSAVVDDLLPRIAGAAGLRPLIQLDHLTVFESEARQTCIGLRFHTPWSVDGIGVRWVDGLVSSVGTDALTEPTR